MLVTIKNTFIDVIDAEAPKGIQRPRSRSFHFERFNEVTNSHEDSLSTAPTVCSPSTRPKDPVGQILITGLPADIDLCALEQKIQDAGLLDQVDKIDYMGSETEHNPIVSITLRNSDYAMSLFQLLHGDELGGCVMHAHLGIVGDSVLPFSSAKALTIKDSPRRGALTTTKLFVGGLKSSTHTRALREYMQRFGPVKDCGIVYDFKGVSRRFGYCEYWSEESVLSVLDLGQHYIDSQIVGIRPYRLRE